MWATANSSAGSSVVLFKPSIQSTHWEAGGGSFHRAIWEFADVFSNKMMLDQQNSSWN